MEKLLIKTQPGTPVTCIPMLRRNKTCIGMILKTPHRTFVLGDFEAAFYMRSDGWSGEGHDPIALLENYCAYMDGPAVTMSQEMTIEHADADSIFKDGYEVTFADAVKMVFDTYNEV